MILGKGKGRQHRTYACCLPLIIFVNRLFFYSWLGSLDLRLGGLDLRLGGFCLMVGNIIQIMGNIMTTTAFWKFRNDARSMRNAVAIFTAGNHFVFVLMTGYATDVMMFGLVGHQQIKGLFVTACTLLGIQILAIGNFQGHVRLMATLAVCLDHVC